MNATCSGTTSSPTKITKSTSRPLNVIQLKAYAANAAAVIGMIVAGMATTRLFTKALAMPPENSTSE